MVKAFVLKLKLALTGQRRLGLMCWYALWVGLGVSLCILAFRAAIDFLCRVFFTQDADAFELLSWRSQAASLLLGSCVIYLLYKLAGAQASQLSVAHVIDRLHNHQGHMPLKNWLLQWFGAVVSLVSGHSVGQEGPIVHLGAGVGAWISFRQKLSPPESRTLLAAGVAAAIGACFDTPLAGVILAFEVVLLRWQMEGVLPVMLAAVVGALAYQLINLPSLHVTFTALPLSYLGWVALGAPLMGLAGCIYVVVNRLALKYKHFPLSLRLCAAGAVTLIIAYWQPSVLGLGFDSLAAVLNNQLTLSALFFLGLCKLLLSPWVVGLGVPGGLIGPNLLAGACLGGAWGALGVVLFGFSADTPQVFALLGMAAVMATTLDAPLAALIAVLELSHSSNFILPAMLMIAGAYLVQHQIMGISGLFIEQLKLSGKPLPSSS